MGLPARNTPFPLPNSSAILDQMELWASWWAGDTGALRDAYQEQSNDHDRSPGLRGLLRRMWWGRVPGPGTIGRNRDAQMHVPVAADIAQGSADLLYAEPPALILPDEAQFEATTSRLQTYVDDGLHDTLASGAEAGAVFGGRFHRVTWDGRVFADRPFLTTVHADRAWPEFAWGRLVAVTFWTDYGDAGTSLGGLRYRHIERHELDPEGNGIVLHGLYLGPADNLGEPVDLTRIPATERLADQVNEDGVLDAPRTPGLMVEYFPNRTPQRLWRNHPIGQFLGRSDFDQTEPLMDALDETVASWMRDIRLGKARIVAPESAMESAGPGSPLSLDLDREVFATINTFTRGDATSSRGLPLEAIQFALRVVEHERTARFFANEIVQRSGYSVRQFQDPAPGETNKTAAEVHAEQGLSRRTRSRKMRLEEPRLARLVEKMLSVDVALGRANGVLPVRPGVEFTDSVQDSPLALGQTLQALRGARAASTETLVRMLHPDWGGEDVMGEVAQIMAEEGAPADPSLLRVRPDGTEVPNVEGPDEG